MKQHKYYFVITECTKILEMLQHNIPTGASVDQFRKEHVKALFRRGQAYHLEKDFDNAARDLTEATKLDESKDAGVRREYEVVHGKIRDAKERQRQAYAKIFQ